MRIALGVEYDGTAFCGWQSQKGERTVQDCLQQAVAKVANHPLQLVCAGRTDTGVHATEQIAHFDTTAQRSPRSWTLGSNRLLSKDISVLWAQPVAPDFHARFKAINRSYRYLIYNRPVRSSLQRNRNTWCHRPLDVLKMHKAAKALLGQHDFSSYRALACQAKSPIRTIHALTVQRQQEQVIIDIRADAFLHHMVRNIAGVLMAIGMGKQAWDWAGQVLALQDRRLGGVTARPEGLYLMRVEYPSHYGLPITAMAHRFQRHGE